MTSNASRRSQIEPFHAMDVLAEANRMRAAGRSVISMAVGQPSSPAPAIVREAARRALDKGEIGYTDALGTPELRQAIARHYADHYALDVDPACVVVTTGSSAAFNLAFLALFDVGDRVAITSPGYPAYRNILAALGLDVVEIALGKEGYLTASGLEAALAHQPIKGLLFASPANPTGAVIPPEQLKQVLEIARKHGVTAISDEIYHRLAYAAPDQSALSLDEDVVVINSFSKYYCMTGWRIGWMIVPRDLVRPIERIQQSLYISAPALSQAAAVHAFAATEELEAVKDGYRRNRGLLLQTLPALGLALAAPLDGAFYAYCDVSGLTNDSMDFAARMLREAGVAATPGLDFDVANGHRFMRFSYAGSHDDMTEALRRLGEWLR